MINKINALEFWSTSC